MRHSQGEQNRRPEGGENRVRDVETLGASMGELNPSLSTLFVSSFFLIDRRCSRQSLKSQFLDSWISPDRAVLLSPKRCLVRASGPCCGSIVPKSPVEIQPSRTIPWFQLHVLRGPRLEVYCIISQHIIESFLNH